MPPAYLRAPDVPGEGAPFVPGCTGKLQQTRRQATGTKRRRSGLSCRAGGTYRCAVCGWWHTSHLSDGVPGGGVAIERRLALGLVR